MMTFPGCNILEVLFMVIILFISTIFPSKCVVQYLFVQSMFAGAE